MPNNPDRNKPSKSSIVALPSALPSAKLREREISSLERRLTPATPADVEERLRVLFAQFPTASSGDVGLRMEGYLLALQGICLEALDATIKAVMKGETECNLDFMPSAPRLAQVCRRFQGYAERELKRVRNQQAQLDGPGYYLEDWMVPEGNAASVGQAVAVAIAPLGWRKTPQQEG
jgi:hypothetical protein